MDDDIVKAILDAAGNRRDRVFSVLINAGLVTLGEQTDVTEPSGPSAEAEAQAEAFEDAAPEAQEPVETPEP